MSEPDPKVPPRLGDLQPYKCWCGGVVKVSFANWFDPVVPPSDTTSAYAAPRWLYTSTCQKCGATDGGNE